MNANESSPNFFVQINTLGGEESNSRKSYVLFKKKKKKTILALSTRNNNSADDRMCYLCYLCKNRSCRHPNIREPKRFSRSPYRESFNNHQCARHLFVRLTLRFRALTLWLINTRNGKMFGSHEWLINRLMFPYSLASIQNNSFVLSCKSKFKKYIIK